MRNDQFVVKPEDIQMHLDRANKLRAEALRASFADFKVALKSAFDRMTRSLSIPRTEQL